MQLGDIFRFSFYFSLLHSLVLVVIMAIIKRWQSREHGNLAVPEALTRF